eukprot:7642137-Lingulodinium_polyedra.AAC.1
MVRAAVEELFAGDGGVAAPSDSGNAPARAPMRQEVTQAVAGALLSSHELAAPPRYVVNLERRPG